MYILYMHVYMYMMYNVHVYCINMSPEMFCGVCYIFVVFTCMLLCRQYVTVCVSPRHVISSECHVISSPRHVISSECHVTVCVSERDGTNELDFS